MPAWCCSFVPLYKIKKKAEKDLHMVVLCMSGGGMKAIAWLIAIFVSFLCDTEHEDIRTGQDVLRSVTLLSTVSASSWFVMSLLYSDVFGGFLEDMAKVDTPKEARELFM
jgi:nitrate/nitrite transporter NarK